MSFLYSSHALVAVSHLPDGQVLLFLLHTYIIREIFPKYECGSLNSPCVRRDHLYPASFLIDFPLSDQEPDLSINEQNPILLEAKVHDGKLEVSVCLQISLTSPLSSLYLDKLTSARS